MRERVGAGRGIEKYGDRNGEDGLKDSCGGAKEERCCRRGQKYICRGGDTLKLSLMLNLFVNKHAIHKTPSLFFRCGHGELFLR